MSNITLKLQTDSILQVPVVKYIKDFVFLVNSQEYETSSICADLLSPIISSRHLTDPTFNKFIINTTNLGDFNKIINLLNFEPQEINDDDYPFILEVFEKLGTNKFSFKGEKIHIELTNNNVFEQLKTHQKYPEIFEKELEKDIEYVSSHFYELKENFLEIITKEKTEFDENIIQSIISNDKLHLEDENDLLGFVNELYLQNRKFSLFYEYVDFKNVEIKSLKNFISIFDMNDLTNSLWISITDRLAQPILNKVNHSNIIQIETKNDQFDGILKYFNLHSTIQNEVKITESSKYSGDPYNLIQYDDLSNAYSTDNYPNSWFCFEFINHKIIPSSYIIRSYREQENDHLKSWIFEGSNDNAKWTKLDEQIDNPALNGKSRVHSFPVSNENGESFKFLRIRQTGPTWSDRHYLLINSIEFYGTII